MKNKNDLLIDACGMLETANCAEEIKRVVESLAIDIERLVRSEISEKLFHLANEVGK